MCHYIVLADDTAGQLLPAAADNTWHIGNMITLTDRYSLGKGDKTELYTAVATSPVVQVAHCSFFARTMPMPRRRHQRDPPTEDAFQRPALPTAQLECSDVHTPKVRLSASQWSNLTGYLFWRHWWLIQVSAGIETRVPGWESMI